MARSPDTDPLDHHVHVKTSRSGPHGRNCWIELDGELFGDTSKLKIEFSADSLNMVTLTFPARITMEEIE